jgi:HlyD family secretion protein
MRNSIWTWATAALVVTVASAWAARDFGRPRGVSVTSAVVTRGPIVRTIVATGTLQPVATVQVGAQISGTIASLSVDYNSIVHKGDVLAKLDTAQLDAVLGEAEAELAEATAALTQAEATRDRLATAERDAELTFSREESLAARDLVPVADLDAARNATTQARADLAAGEAQIAEARAGVEQARAQAEQARVNRDHAVITSPIDGVVVARNVEVGQTVASTLQAPVLFELAADFRHMQIEVDIDESDIGGIETGSPATFEVESYPDVFTGTVAQVRLQPVAEQTAVATTAGSPSAASSTIVTVVGYATMVEVANPDQKLRPGMTATVTLHGSRVADALRIPNAALSFRPPPDVLDEVRQAADTGMTAAVASGDAPIRRLWRFDGSQFTPIDVHTGITDGKWTEAVGASALRDGELLITSASVGTENTPGNPD